MYAFYSAAQAKLVGIVQYQTPDGQIVEATCISKTKDHDTGFDDIVCVGKVSQFVKRISEGTITFQGGKVSRHTISTLLHKDKAEHQQETHRWN